MAVEINDILHVLAHELRTPVGIAHGYVRLLLDDRLPQETERRRALEQMQKALGRLSDLSHETTSLASWYEQDLNHTQAVDARAIAQRVAEADYDFPVTVEISDVSEGTSIRTTNSGALERALIGIVRATARELRGTTCDVIARTGDARFELLAGPEDLIDTLRAGPSSPDASPLALERGGLGLTLVHAAIVLDAHHAERWTMNGLRKIAGIRLPLHERPHQ
jgi:signal transduction histidine kinase